MKKRFDFYVKDHLGTYFTDNGGQMFDSEVVDTLNALDDEVKILKVQNEALKVRANELLKTLESLTGNSYHPFT